jgi:RNA polymerase sigma factor (sigma-70 family)
MSFVAGPSESSAVEHRDDGEKTFKRFYEKSHAVAAKFAARLVGRHKADDVVQEAFLRLLAYRGGEASTLTLPFFLTVVRNVAHDLRRGRAVTGIDDVPGVADRMETKPPAGSKVDNLAEWIAERLAELPESQYDAVVLTELRGLSEVQAATVLCLSRSAIGAKRRSAIESLRTRVRLRSGQRLVVTRTAGVAGVRCA